MKNRIKQRANRKLKTMEERLEKRNHYGNKDLAHKEWEKETGV